jgi:hypothetical protein
LADVREAFRKNFPQPRNGKNQVADIVAQAFAAEGVDTVLALMGDPNMYWWASMVDKKKVRLILARHEHCCVIISEFGLAAKDRHGRPDLHAHRPLVDAVLTGFG